jgi:hypothetical protein
MFFYTAYIYTKENNLKKDTKQDEKHASRKFTSIWSKEY